MLISILDYLQQPSSSFLKCNAPFANCAIFAYLSSKHEVSGTVYSTGINSYVVFFLITLFKSDSHFTLFIKQIPGEPFFFLVALINLFIDSNLFAWQVVLFLTNIENRLLLFATSATRTAESVTVASLRVEAPALSVRASHFFFLSLPHARVAFSERAPVSSHIQKHSGQVD